MIDLEQLTDDAKEILAASCEDFLLHRNIPLRGSSPELIIQHALREGFQLSKISKL